MLGEKIKDINIDAIRHDDKYCYVFEGHGGRPVYTWPIYRFYYMYIHESKKKAKEGYELWYLDQYMKYRFFSKKKGGMLEGSLDRLVVSKKDNGKVDEQVLLQAIAERVKQRFDIANSIMNDGYIPNHDDPIKGIKKGTTVLLKCGHHRVAILAALGKNIVPNIYVYDEYYIYNLHRLVKNSMRALYK